METCSRRICFSSGHRVMGHEGNCAKPHGHNYIVWITASAETLDSIGRVIDFSVLKAKVGGWLLENWDHRFIIYKEDGDTISAFSSIPGAEPFILPTNPTAENMAKYLLREICPVVLEGTGVTVTKIVLYETENCYAEATL